MKNTDKYEDLLRDNVIPAFGFRVACYYNSDGDLAYKVALDDDDDIGVPISSVLGVIELAKGEILYAAIKHGL